jgi:hypothetical protein
MSDANSKPENIGKTERTYAKWLTHKTVYAKVALPI